MKARGTVLCVVTSLVEAGTGSQFIARPARPTYLSAPLPVSRAIIPSTINKSSYLLITFMLPFLKKICHVLVVCVVYFIIVNVSCPSVSPFVFVHHHLPSPLYTLVLLAKPQHYALLSFMQFTTLYLCFSCFLVIPHHYKASSSWTSSVIHLLTTNSSSQGQPLSISQHFELSFPEVTSIPYHYQVSLPGPNTIYLSPLQSLTPRGNLYLSLTTTNSPSQDQTLSISHHYELSLPGPNTIYLSPLQILPPRGNLYLSLTTTNSHSGHTLSTPHHYYP